MRVILESGKALFKRTADEVPIIPPPIIQMFIFVVVRLQTN